MSPLSSSYSRHLHTVVAATTLAITVAVQGVASAHPGHGIAPDGGGPTHYVLEPSHGISIAFILLATLAASWIIRHSRKATGKQTPA